MCVYIYRYFAYTFIGLILLIFVPESPYYLIAKKRHCEAREVIKLLNTGDDSTINSIIDDIEQYMERGISSKPKKAFDPLNSVQKNNVPDSEEGCKLSPIPEVGIVEINKEVPICDPFLPKSKESDKTSCRASSSMFKIVMIIAGLFLFTRLIGMLPCMKIISFCGIF
jgi:hypothetical protein